MKVAVLGAGFMGEAYLKVLRDMRVETLVVSRSEKTALEFEAKTGFKCLSGGLEKVAHTDEFLKCTHAIIATPVETLYDLSRQVLETGIKHVLVEKPGFLFESHGKELDRLAARHQAQVFIAYNRRFYASVLKAKEMMELDGGVRDIQFEFTEWLHVIEPLVRGPKVKEHWFLANSTHVVDLAFHLAGNPLAWNNWVDGSFDWHPSGSRFAGAGITDKGVLFSYLSDWNAPGRWALEVMTEKRRFIFKPLEKLSVQSRGSVVVEEVSLDDDLDTQYKPGLYRMVSGFLHGSSENLCTLKEHLDRFQVYCRMANYT